MKFKAIRLSLNLTQDQVAASLGVKRSTVAMWEAGKSKPRADTLIKLSKLYKCTIEDLFRN